MLQFHLGPFPVRIDASFLLTAVLLGWSGRGDVAHVAAWVLIVFISVLVHELGHALVGLSQGGQPEIVLQGLGGVTFPRLRKRTSYAQQIWLSVAGPLAGLLPGAIALAVLLAQRQIAPTAPLELWRQVVHLSSHARDPLHDLLATLAEMSVLWTVFNLVPVIPLDGGHVLEIALAAVRKKPAPALANWISAAVGMLVALALFFLMGQLFAALFFVVMAVSSIGRANASGRAGPAQGRPDLPTDATSAQVAAALAQARAALGANDLDSALRIADALESAPDPFRQSAGARIRAGVSLLRSDYLEAGRQAGRAYALAPQPESAVLASRAALRAGQAEIAKTWLRRARESGAPVDALRGDPELGALV